MDNVLAEMEARQRARTVFTFEFPEEIVQLGDPFFKQSIGLVKLWMDEELTAVEIAKQNAGRAVFFTLVKALVEVDGRRVDAANAEAEKLLNYTDPVIRDLIADAYSSISKPVQKTTDAFLKSRKAKVGS